MWAISFLILFNIFFFWEIYQKPFTLATGELLSTFFPTWRGPRFNDYWGDNYTYPVLSSFYPPQVILKALSEKLSDDRAFRVYVYHLLLHFLFGSIGWYFAILSITSSVWVALLGALTFTYQAFHIRQQPCLVYTISWFPWMLCGLAHASILSSIAVGMMLLGGYYPLAIYILPLGFLINPWQMALSTVIGSIIALPQLIPFIKHLPKTIKQKAEPIPTPPWESKFYFGIVPLLLASWWHLVLIPVVICLYLLRFRLPRVPFRSGIIICYGFIALSLLQALKLPKEAIWALIVIQALDLWLHNRLLPSRPYCELYNKPSRAFNTTLTKYLDKHLTGKVSGLPWPLFTGLINRFKTIGYCGSMQTKEMWAWRRSFKHDPFIDGIDENELTKRNVQFAYTCKKLDWIKTPVRFLYRNPAL